MIHLLKIDTEGADYLVLKGAAKMLDKFAPIIFCEYNRSTEKGFEYKLGDLIDLMKSKSYDLYEIKKGKLIYFDPVTSNSSDLICFKNSHQNLFIKYI